MKYKFAMIGCMIVSGCVSSVPAAKDADLIRILVEAPSKTSFERLVTAAQPLAAQACAEKQQQAQWVVAKAVSPTRTSLAFTCW